MAGSNGLKRISSYLGNNVNGKEDSRTNNQFGRKPKIGDKIKLIKDWDAWPDEIEGTIDSIDETGTRITIEGSAFVYRTDTGMPVPKFKICYLDEDESTYYFKNE